MLLAAFILFFFLALGWIWGAGYQPSKRSIRNELIGVLEDRFHSERFVFYDLGSGYGGLLIDVAERFPNSFCTGIEADWFKYVIARRRVRKNGLAIFIKANLLKTYFTDADVVYMYLSPLILKKQEFRDRIKSLKPGCLIISYCHRISGLEPANVIGKDLFIYVHQTP